MASLNDLVPSGVVTGDDLLTLMEHARANGYAIPAVNCTRYVTLPVRRREFLLHLQLNLLVERVDLAGLLDCRDYSAMYCCDSMLSLEILDRLGGRCCRHV